jgi:hypothetical protein
LFGQTTLLPRHMPSKSVSDVVITKCQPCGDTVPSQEP